VPEHPTQPNPEAQAAPSAEVGPPAVPEQGRLREYLLLEQIGRGGMGTVYRALHTRLDKFVAVKTLPAERMSHPAAVARFAREMKAGRAGAAGAPPSRPPARILKNGCAGCYNGAA